MVFQFHVLQKSCMKRVPASQFPNNVCVDSLSSSASCCESIKIPGYHSFVGQTPNYFFQFFFHSQLAMTWNNFLLVVRDVGSIPKRQMQSIQRVGPATARFSVSPPAGAGAGARPHVARQLKKLPMFQLNSSDGVLVKN